MAAKALVFDIETNGLREECDKIWCIGLKGFEDPCESFSSEPGTDTYPELEDGLEELSGASRLIGHNIINFDLPVLQKLRGWTPDEDTEIYDTLVVSRLLNPDRKKPSNSQGKGGPHSLESWGYRVGRGKVDNDEWRIFSPNILRRVHEDVEINHLTDKALRIEMGDHDWSEAIEIEHKVAEIITRQEMNGVNFDLGGANSLVDTLSTLIDRATQDLISRAPKTIKKIGAVPVNKPFKVNGEYTKVVRDYYDSVDETRLVGGPYSRITFEDINLSSQTQVKEWLLNIGWEPTQWNTKDGINTSPKLTEDSFDSLPSGIGEALKNRTLLSHRRSQIQGWIDNVRESDGRIEAGGNPCGTPTGRFRHFGVVNVPKAAKQVPWGREMRSLFICSPGRRFVGHDASGLELRMLAHYMNDPVFTEAVVNGRNEDGTDIHTLNQKAAGLPTRDDAKTFIYAFIYGAGDAKLGSIVGGGTKEGKRLRAEFLKNYPALDKLIKNVKRAAGKGWLRGLDNRKIFMRTDDYGRPMTHKALNTLLQCAGAVVMKKSMIILDEDVKREQLDVLKVIDMHDEAQADVLEKDVEKYVELAEQSIVKAGQHFNLRCELDAEAKVGNNWKETH